MLVRKRYPHIVIAPRSNSGKPLFGHAHNRERHRIQFDRAPHHLPRTSKRALPVTIIQHGNGRRSQRVITRINQPPRRGSQSQRMEKISRNQLPVDHARRPIAGQIQPPGIRKRSRPRKNIRLRNLAIHRL